MMLSIQIAGGIILAIIGLVIGYFLLLFLLHTFGESLNYMFDSQKRKLERDERNSLVTCISMLKKAKKRGDPKQIEIWKRNLSIVKQKVEQQKA